MISIIATVKQMSRESLSVDSAFHKLSLDSIDTVVLLSEPEDYFKIAISNDEAQSIVRA